MQHLSFTHRFRSYKSRPTRASGAALRLGQIDHLRVHGNVVSFTRSQDDQAIHCAFNIGGTAHDHASPAGETILSVNNATPHHLPAWGAIYTIEIDG